MKAQSTPTTKLAIHEMARSYQERSLYCKALGPDARGTRNNGLPNNLRVDTLEPSSNQLVYGDYFSEVIIDIAETDNDNGLMAWLYGDWERMKGGKKQPLR